MRVLALGDAVGSCGCNKLKTALPELKRWCKADLTIVNGENSDDGNGISLRSSSLLFGCGADVITTGNHVYRQREIYDELDRDIGIVRPANYHPDSPGVGSYLFEKGPMRALIVNLSGQLFMEAYESPFACIDRILAKNAAKIVIVDIHAEATSEKIALGYHLDGRASLVFGTHTHVQTADEKILPGGTGYITDLGMCGAVNSVLGMKKEPAIRRLITKMPERFETASGECTVNGIFAEIDNSSGKVTHIERINLV